LIRLAQNLLRRGHEVKILTTDPGFDSDIVDRISVPKGIAILNRNINRIVPNYFSFSAQEILRKIKAYNPDIINIHWTHGHTIPIGIIPQLHKHYRIFWSIHDLWPITKNSFFEYTGGKSLASMNKATLRGKLKRLRVIPNVLFDYKVRLLSDLPIRTISPSKWLQQKVEASRVFRSAVNLHIPNGVDTDTFRPLDKNSVRDKYTVPGDHYVVLFLAANLADERKGFYYFVKAINQLCALNPALGGRITVALVGGDERAGGEFSGVNVRCLGSTRDVSQLVDYYNLADIFVSTSLADNFPSTSLESSACGTPIVAFDVGGVAEIVIDASTGLLADSGNVTRLAECMNRLFTDGRLLGEMGAACRSYVETEFGMDQFVDRYVAEFRAERAPA